MMMIVVMMMIASYTNDDDSRRDDDRIVHKWWWWSSSWPHRTLVMMSASYMHWLYTMRSFLTEGRTNKAILGVGYENIWEYMRNPSQWEHWAKILWLQMRLNHLLLLLVTSARPAFKQIIQYMRVYTFTYTYIRVFLVFCVFSHLHPNFPKSLCEQASD